MSQENVEIVRSALAALGRRDVEAYLQLTSGAFSRLKGAARGR